MVQVNTTTEIVIIRHGHAAPIVGDSYEAEMARLLTPTGYAQAFQRRLLLGSPTFGVILSSPATRTRQTAQVVSGGVGEIQALPELCWTPGTEFDRVLGALFKKLAYAPLNACRIQGGTIFDDQARHAWSRIKTLVDWGRDCSVLIVGHAVMVAALGCAAAAGDYATDLTLSSRSFEECDGFKLSFISGRLSQLQLLQNLPTF